jgi:hypothetical protein
MTYSNEDGRWVFECCCCHSDEHPVEFISKSKRLVKAKKEFCDSGWGIRMGEPVRHGYGDGGDYYYCPECVRQCEPGNLMFPPCNGESAAAFEPGRPHCPSFRGKRKDVLTTPLGRSCCCG